MGENSEKDPRKAFRQQLSRARGDRDFGEKDGKDERTRLADFNLSPWIVYTRDAKDYVDLFAPIFPEIKELSEKFKDQHERGEEVLVVDLLGEANAWSLGADHSICFTRTRDPKAAGDTKTVVEGDLYLDKDVRRLLQTVDFFKVPISCVFCKPVAGIKGDKHSAYSFKRLYDVLASLYARLASEGDMYIRLLYMHDSMEILSEKLNSLSPPPIVLRLC